MATILLIDDSALALEITKEMLTELGHQVLATADPHEFLQLLQNSPHPHLAILDSIMPKVSGSELIAQVQALPDLGLSQLPLIMATALDEQTPPASGVLMLSKPFTLDELQAVVNFALA